MYILSVDPKRDSPNSRKRFIKKNNLKTTKFLSSEVDKTRNLAAELGMGFSEQSNSPHAMHTMTLALLNFKGEILAVMPILSEETEKTVERIVTIFAQNGN